MCLFLSLFIFNLRVLPKIYYEASINFQGVFLSVPSCRTRNAFHLLSQLFDNVARLIWLMKWKQFEAKRRENFVSRRWWVIATPTTSYFFSLQILFILASDSLSFERSLFVMCLQMHEIMLSWRFSSFFLFLFLIAS